MPSIPPTPQMQSETVAPDAAPKKPMPKLPGVEGIWVFVAADMVFFGVLFFSFMVERSKDVALFEASRLTLNADFGGINTLILLTSSWCVVRAVSCAKHNKLAQLPHWLIAAFSCGLAFWVSKIIEYSQKWSIGLTPLSNDFYMLYYCLTGLHLLHVTAGTIMLFIFWRSARTSSAETNNFSSDQFVRLESGAIYWHMVDLLWILMFPLIYLLR